MTDINSGSSDALHARGADQRDAPAAERPADAPAETVVGLVELLFFAYRDFTGEADAALQELGFGRAHHRVLHFVNRRPGLRVADLLDILRITKQSLARVLKQLVDEGYIEQMAGMSDRRERRLYVTYKGECLARDLMAMQVVRVEGALAQLRAGGEQQVRDFLHAMIEPEAAGNVPPAADPR